ncbi:hypothetical protein SELMODRAFT_420616 [Selaginella moellendorffii]|uniref:Uncharacterized protein n=1 Tax=Selaginella moellendorffii TaxID=88036 RepID=D8SCK1_SELML|nr:hypothetical protein SELMODRAFT_420616 [Selaginella moellendorffii]
MDKCVASVLLVVVESVPLDQDLCVALGRLYVAQKDWFPDDEAILAIIQSAPPLHTFGEFHQLTGQKFHRQLARRLADHGHIAEALSMLDERCDEPTFTQTLLHYHPYYPLSILVRYRHVATMTALGYPRDFRLFEIPLELASYTTCQSLEMCNAVKMLFRQMLEEHPSRALGRNVYKGLVCYYTSDDFSFFHLVLAEAKAKNANIPVHEITLLRHFQHDHVYGYEAKVDAVLDLHPIPEEAYQKLFELTPDLKDALSLLKRAKLAGVRLDPSEKVAASVAQDSLDVYAMDLLKESGLLSDAAIAGLANRENRQAILKVVLRNKRWCAFPQSIEAMLREGPKMWAWLSRVMVSKKSSQEVVKQLLQRGLVATALELLSGRCDEGTFTMVLLEAVKMQQSETMVKRIRKKQAMMKSLGYKCKLRLKKGKFELQA